MTGLLLLASVPLVIGGALLFTNAVEWLGRALNLGQSAVGSLVAAIGTALPESLIPIVALIGGAESSTDVAIGAIVGAPFVLGTIAMIVLALSARAYRRRRRTGAILEADESTVRRDLVFFIAFFAAAIALGLGVPAALRIAAAVAFVAAFLAFARATLGDEAETGTEGEELGPLYFDRRRPERPATWRIAAQSLAGLGVLVAGAELFVKGVVGVAEGVGLSPLVIALVLGPLVTEIPEKTNSVIWVREGKDTLAVGNVTGAMAFQATVPVAVGLAFSGWALDRFAIAAGGAGLAGGLLAYYALTRRKPLRLVHVLIWAALFAGFAAFAVTG